LNIYKQTSQIETFRFIDMKNFSAEDVSLPIDKTVATLLKQKEN
jgi:hypothetical protein